MYQLALPEGFAENGTTLHACAPSRRATNPDDDEPVADLVPGDVILTVADQAVTSENRDDLLHLKEVYSIQAPVAEMIGSITKPEVTFVTQGVAPTDANQTATPVADKPAKAKE